MARQQAEIETQDTNVAVLERMTDILEQLQKNAPPNEPGFGHPEYQARLREEGFFDQFAVKVWQNGKMAEARGLRKDTIERAAKLTPGTYAVKGIRVDVAVDGRGEVYLSYPSATMTDRMKFAGAVRNFDDLIDQLWAQMHPA